MRVQTIVYVTDMNRSRDWYSRVLGAEPAAVSDIWTPFTVGDATVALHRAADLGDGTRCELSLVVDRSLEEIAARLEAAGVAIERGISDEAFGRSILLRDPDGSALQVNEHG